MEEEDRCPDDVCPECGKKYDYEDYITERECEEFWGAPCYYEVVVAVVCHSCGERIDY